MLASDCVLDHGASYLQQTPLKVVIIHTLFVSKMKFEEEKFIYTVYSKNL